jgi:RNA polymerase sigma-70 factor (sigma-E family)
MGTMEARTGDEELVLESAEVLAAVPGLTFDALYLQEHDRLVRLAALLLGSTLAAEDVVQEAFAKLATRFDRVDVPPAWLRTVVVRSCHNERRRLATARRHAHRLGIAATQVMDPPVDDVVAAVRRLPVRQRAVIVLRFYGDFSEAEIAEALGMRPGTVKSSLHRALASLREEVER